MTAIFYRRSVLPAAALPVWLALATCALAEAPPDSPAVQRLAEYGLAPTAESLSGYLASLQPSPEQQAALRLLVQQLGDKEFARREEASRQLLRQVTGVTPLLEQAVTGDDPEIRWRAKLLLDQTGRQGKLLLDAVFSAIHERKISGLCGPLMSAAAYCTDEQLRSHHRRALIATVTPADAILLRQQLAADDPQARSAALAALAAAVGNGADDDAQRLLTDVDEWVQASAARVLADHGHRECLPVLVRLLESSNTLIRLKAIQTLRQLTGNHFNYRGGSDSSERRLASISEWKAWLARDGATAPLTFPLRDANIDLGRLLVCDHTKNLLIEFDTAGRQVWQREVGVQPWACVGMADGHRLVGCYGAKSVVEYDEKGEEIWRYDDLPGGPTSVQRLENGNTLVACTEGLQVLEIDLAKRIVWKVTLEGRPVDARRLDNGLTLVTLQHAQKVMEIDSSGKSAWEISGLGMAFSAERLENGNTLVCSPSHKTVREYDRSGAIVWEKGKFANPYGAQRLASGNTIVVDNSGLTEIDSEGTVVNHIQMQNASRAWRY